MDTLEKTIVAVQEMLERVTDYVNKVLVSIGYANCVKLNVLKFSIILIGWE